MIYKTAYCAITDVHLIQNKVKFEKFVNNYINYMIVAVNVVSIFSVQCSISSSNLIPWNIPNERTINSRKNRVRLE